MTLQLVPSDKGTTSLPILSGVEILPPGESRAARVP